MRIIFVLLFSTIFSTAEAFGLCREVQVFIVEKQRVKNDLRIAPGDCRTISFRYSWPIVLAEIRILKRPSHGSIAPSSSGIGGAHEVRANSMAAGNDSYVIRAELNRYMHGTAGTRIGEQTWAEVEFLLTYGK